MNHFIFFIRNQINRPEFKICFAILFLLSTGGMILCYIQNYHSDFMFIRSAADSFLLASTESRVAEMFFVLLFPLLAASICTGYGRQSNLFSTLKMTKKQYIYGNAITIVWITTATFFALLSLNQLLCLAAFPLSGADNKWGMTEYDLIQGFQEHFLFDIWCIQNPYCYNFLHIAIISILAGGIALLTYGLGYTKILGQLKPIQLSIFVFIIFVILFIFSNFLDIPLISFISYVEMGHPVNVLQYTIFAGCIYIAGIVLTITGRKRYEYMER